MIKVFTSENHHQHSPPFSVFEGGVRHPYFENPERIDRIVAALKKCSWAKFMQPSDFSLAPILAVHDAGYVEFLRTAYQNYRKIGGELGPEHLAEVLTPGTFVMRRTDARVPTSFPGQLGYYGTDTHAPIVEGTFAAAMDSAQCALSAAQAIIDGDKAAFSLARPPGHHAGRDYCGGFCYLNNTAIAARWLANHHKVAVLDIDFHAGHGTQDIFYDSPEILTISIHGDPSEHYPWYMGYAEETGSGAGKGFHKNIPLPAGVDDRRYMQALDEAITAINNFKPTALVLAAGMDILESDPLGAFKVSMGGVEKIGERIAGLNLPTLICMEGGYNHAALGDGILKLLRSFV